MCDKKIFVAKTITATAALTSSEKKSNKQTGQKQTKVIYGWYSVKVV